MAAPTSQNVNFLNITDSTTGNVPINGIEFGHPPLYYVAGASGVDVFTNYTDKKYGPITFRCGNGTKRGSLRQTLVDDNDIMWINNTDSTKTGLVEYCCGCWYRQDSNPGMPNNATGDANIMSISGMDVVIEEGTGGAARFGNGTDYVSCGTLQTDTWHYVEALITPSATATEQFCWIDGTRYDISCSNNNQVNEEWVFFGGDGDLDGIAYIEAPWSGWLTSDSGTDPSPFFNSPAVVAEGAASDDGTNNDWTGVGDTTNKYNNIDNPQQGSIATVYNSETTTNGVQTHGFGIDLSTTYSGLNYTVELVCAMNAVVRTSNPDCAGELSWDSGAINLKTFTSSNIQFYDDVDWYGKFWSSHERDASNAWTEATAEAITITATHQQSQSRELRLIHGGMAILVDISEAGGLSLAGVGGGLVGKSNGQVGNGGI